MVNNMRGKEAKVTIYDVAKKAGVSKSTVSRYLGGRFHELSPKTRQKIKQVIDELQYRPNNLARGLKNSRSYLIGALVADITNPYTTEQPTYQIGKTVMELILKRLADNESPAQTISYQTRLIERGSAPGR